MSAENNSYTYKWTTSICEFLHQYIVDIFGCLIPGCAFLLLFEMFLRINAPIVKLLLLDNSNDVIISSINVCVAHVHNNVFLSLMVAYIVGMLFNRRSLQQPDSISQIVRSLDRCYKTGIVSMMVYFLVCCLGSIKKFIFEFNAHIRKDCEWCKKNCAITQKNGEHKKDASGNAGSANESDFAGGFKEEDSGVSNSTTSVEGADRLSRIVHGILLNGKSPDEFDVKTKEEKQAKRIATGGLKIWHCIYHFIKREVLKYIIMLLYIFLLLFFADVAASFSNGIWYIGVLVVMAGSFMAIYYCASLRRVFIRTKDEFSWRNCEHKEDYNDSVKKEAWNRCAFLKAQLVRYPYEDFYEVYLKVRDCTWLNQYGWDRAQDKNGESTYFRKCANLRIIESMKLRLYQCTGLNTQNLRRLEAQVRLVGTIWHMSKFFILLCWSILFAIIAFDACQFLYDKIPDYKEPVSSAMPVKCKKTITSKKTVKRENQVVREEIIEREETIICNKENQKGESSLRKIISEYLKNSSFLSFLNTKAFSSSEIFCRNLALFLVAFLVNYSISSFFHFLRLKEVHHILELFNHYVRTFKRYNNGIPGQTCPATCDFPTGCAVKPCAGDTILNESDFYRYKADSVASPCACGARSSDEAACSKMAGCAYRAGNRSTTSGTTSSGGSGSPSSGSHSGAEGAAIATSVGAAVSMHAAGSKDGSQKTRESVSFSVEEAKPSSTELTVQQEQEKKQRKKQSTDMIRESVPEKLAQENADGSEPDEEQPSVS